MVDSERTFKIKVRSHWKFCLRQQLFAFKQFCIEKTLLNIFKTTNATKLTNAILKSFIDLYKLHLMENTKIES